MCSKNYIVLLLILLNVQYTVNPITATQDYNNDFRSKRKQNREDFTFWLRSTYAFMLFLIAVLFIYYVWILNINATRGYNIRDLEMEKNQLLRDKELLDVKISELESLDTIKNPKNIKNLNMEKVEEHSFIIIKKDVQYVYNN